MKSILIFFLVALFVSCTPKEVKQKPDLQTEKETPIENAVQEFHPQEVQKNQEEQKRKFGITYVSALDGLRVRNAPSLDGERIDGLTFGAEVRIADYHDNLVSINGVSGKWAFITYPINGWVFDAFLNEEVGAAGFEWQADGNGGVRISGYSGTSSAVTIPVQIIGIPITRINASAFARKNLTSVIIEEGVTEIPWTVFTENKITAVSLPESLTSIGYGAFERNDLTNVTIPNNVTIINNLAFRYNQLTSVTFPKSLTSIGNAAFSYNRLTHIDLPDSITFIGDWAFNGNELTEITIPEKITVMHTRVFSDNQLTSVTLPKSLTHIHGGAFAGNHLTHIDLPDSLTFIGLIAFARNQLTSVTIPSSVTEISDAAFFNNPITSVTIGANVTLGEAIFGTPGERVEGHITHHFRIDDGFRDTYNSGGKLAGTYTRENIESQVWTRRL
jgi:hypothetical protein